VRVAATNQAFTAIALISAAMCALAALIAWFTQPGAAAAGRASARNPGYEISS